MAPSSKGGGILRYLYLNIVFHKTILLVVVIVGSLGCTGFGFLCFVFVALLRLLAPKRPPSVMFQGSASVCVCGVQYLGYGTHSKKIRSAVPSLLSLPKIPSRPYHNEKHSLFYCVSETVNDPKKEGTKGRRTSE